MHQSESIEQLVSRVQRINEGGEDKSVAASQQHVLRTYGLGSQILADLGVCKMRVMGHPIKTPGISGFGLDTVEYIDADTAVSGTSKITKIK